MAISGTERAEAGNNSRSLMTMTRSERWAVRALYGGLGFTVVAMSVPFVDHTTENVLADHLPPLLGWVGLLPGVAGLLAVTLLWRKR